jgi:translocation and assembly module TamB
LKRIFWILITPAILITIFIWCFQEYFAPQILHVAIEKVERLSRDEGPFAVKIKNAELLYFPPGLKTSGVTLKPKAPWSQSLSDIEVQSAEARLEIFSLLIGRLKVAMIQIETPQVEVSFTRDPDSNAEFKLPKKIDWAPILAKLQEIPLEQLQIRNLNLKLREKKSQSTLSLYPTDLQILQLKDLLQIKLSIPNAIASWNQTEKLKTELQFAVVITPQNVRIQKLSLINEAIKFQLSGELKAQKKKSPQAQVLWTASVDLNEIHKTISLIFPDKKIPRFSGEVKAQGSWTPQLNDFLNLDFNLQTEKVNIEDFNIGNAQIKGTLKGQELNLENLKAQHPAGEIQIKNTKMKLEPHLPISLNLAVDRLDLQKLFQSLHLNNIPVYLSVTGEAPCIGQLKPLSFDCDFNAQVSDVKIDARKAANSFEILKLKTLSGKGTTHIDLEKVTFQGSLAIDQSKGEAFGSVEFLKGFDISFKSTSLLWSEIENLAHLNLEGVSQLAGRTHGNSESATLDMSLKTTGHSISDFYLGDTEVVLEYEKGHLLIPTVKGRIDQSLYSANLDIDLLDSKIKGQLDFSKARLQDIKKSLERAIPIPIELEGNGKAQAVFSGPLDFWKLTSKLKGQFNQIKMATESFKDLNLEIESNEGLFQIKKAEATRNQTTLSATGSLSSEKNLNLEVVLQNYLLEESDFISRMKWPLNGRLNSQMILTGNLKNPNLKLNGQFTELLLDDNEVPNSNFKIEIANQNLLFEGVFLGNQIQSIFEYPLIANGSPLRFRLKTQNWDYTPWLSLINAGSLNQDTSGNLTSEIDLASPNGNLEQLSGTIKIQTFALTKQDLTLKNSEPLSITAKNGVYDVQNFLLNSAKGNVEVRGENIRPSDLNLQINADSDLKLAQLFIPLFEEISGAIHLRSTISGKWDRPQLIGSLKVDNGYFRIKNFPHPFEKVKIDTTFSQSRILFNEIKSNLGGGEISGEGSMQIQGKEDIPMLIRLKARGISLNIPDKVRTRGDADITFSGKWFPFTLAGTYRIASTNFEMNFNSGKLGSDVKQNYYLPRTIKEKIADPLNLDLQLIFEKPILVKNSLLDAQATGQLGIKGSPTLPVLNGKLTGLKGSKLFFKDKPFEIQSASIQFQNPNEIDPELFISAQTRVEEYDISLIVQGTAKDPSVRLSSQPPLAENDIISLLALGVTSTKLATVDSKEQQNQTANEVFAAAFQSTGLTQKVQSATGFNVQLSNSFDTTRNISVPKFTISRKLTQKTNASVAFPVTGDQKTPEGRVQYNLSDNLSINGSYETKKFEQSNTQTDNREIPSILGLDLEFKREFR